MSILQLLSGEDQPLLVRWDALFVLDLGLDIVDRVGRFHFEGDGFAGQCLDKDLHTTMETEDEVKGRLLLDIVVREGAAILKLFASKDEVLLVRWDTLLALNLCFDIINGVRRLNLEGDSLVSEGLYEHLNATMQTQDQVDGRLFLSVAIGQCAIILKLLSGKDEKVQSGEIL